MQKHCSQCTWMEMLSGIKIHHKYHRYTKLTSYCHDFHYDCKCTGCS